MSISAKDVLHIAELARIELTPEEIKRFETELSGILSFIDSLNKLNTEEVAPVRGGTLLENEMRADELLHDDIEQKAQALMSQAPAKKDHWLKVKAIFQ